MDRIGPLLRQDCAFVKYGTNQRGGMYLGRVFLATDAVQPGALQGASGLVRYVPALAPATR
jgi:hypothetical protein